jgi:hypothetical protein
VNEEHPDMPLLEHSKDLISQLRALGITPSPPVEADGDVSDGWEDDEGSEDGDGDIEMD